jgi:hypothetical protein
MLTLPVPGMFFLTRSVPVPIPVSVGVPDRRWTLSPPVVGSVGAARVGVILTTTRPVTWTVPKTDNHVYSLGPFQTSNSHL